MERPLSVRSFFALVVLLLAALLGHEANARSLTRLEFQVDLVAGTTRAVPRGTVSTHPSTATPQCTTATASVHIGGAALVVDTGVSGAPPTNVVVGGDARNTLHWAYESTGLVVVAVNVFTPGAAPTQSSLRGLIVAVERATGHVRWRHATGSTIPRCFVVAPSHIAIVGLEGFELIDTANGNTVWPTLHTSGWPQSLRPLSGSLWLLHTDRQLAAIDIATGRERWTAPTTREQSPVVLGNMVLTLDAPRPGPSARIGLRVFDALTGSSRTMPLTTYPNFYDSVSLSTGLRSPNLLDVELVFIVLD